MTRQASTKYYQKSKEKIQISSRERYQNLSEEEKSNKREYGRERYKHFSEDEKQKLQSLKKYLRLTLVFM